MESIRLWLALTPKQFEDLDNGKEIQPDEYSKRFGRLLPSSVLSTSMIGHRKVQRVSFVPKTMSWSRSKWPPLAIFRKPSREFSWNISPMNTVGRERWDPKSMTSAEICYTDFLRRLTKSSEHRGNMYISSLCIVFNGSRSGGSARLGSRR